ncbi:pfkB carbohydrate kinase family protein [Mycobacterium avium MAV_120809_2495]|nr:pfkB carbohydrate kinase family protein [Mycobacterium avium MAV_120809_2495]
MTPNLDEVRLLVDIDVTDAASQRDAAKALHALGPQWVLVKGGHLRSSQRSCDLLYDGDSCYEFDAHRLNTGNDHGGGDTLASAVACALAHGFTVPDAVAFGKRWVTECCAPPIRWATATAPSPRCSGCRGTDEPRPDRGHRPPARRHPRRRGGAHPRRRRQPGFATAAAGLR